MANNALVEVRAEITALLHDFKDHGNDEAFAEFERRHPDLLAKASRDLHRLAFIKLLNDVGGRPKRMRIEADQDDLFGNVKHPDMIVVPLFKNGKMAGRKRVDFDDASVEDVAAWWKQQKAPKNGRADRYEMIGTMLEVIDKHGLDRSLNIRQARLLAVERAAEIAAKG